MSQSRATCLCGGENLRLVAGDDLPGVGEMPAGAMGEWRGKAGSPIAVHKAHPTTSSTERSCASARIPPWPPWLTMNARLAGHS